MATSASHSLVSSHVERPPVFQWDLDDGHKYADTYSPPLTYCGPEGFGLEAPASPSSPLPSTPVQPLSSPAVQPALPTSKGSQETEPAKPIPDLVFRTYSYGSLLSRSKSVPSSFARRSTFPSQGFPLRFSDLFIIFIQQGARPQSCAGGQRRGRVCDAARQKFELQRIL